MLSLIVVCTLLAAASGSPRLQRIKGGEETTIDQYPFAAALLRSDDGVNFVQRCGGTILNARSILTAAGCFHEIPYTTGDGYARSVQFVDYAWRVRVGSSYASSGGSVHDFQQIFVNPDFNPVGGQNDIAVVRVATFFTLGANVQATGIGGPDYILPDNTPVWTIGWGETSYGGETSEQLRRVQIRTFNQETCRHDYNIISIQVTEDMICAGDPEAGKDTCSRDFGGSLLHNNVVIAVSNWGCEWSRLPGIYSRVTKHTDWIVSVA